MSDVEEVDWQWFGFSLAISCASAENISDFLALFESGVFQDAQFALMGRYECELLLKNALLEDEQKDRIKQLMKKLGRKIRSNREYLDNLANNPPILIAQ
jgi:hypothetical protein